MGFWSDSVSSDHLERKGLNTHVLDLIILQETKAVYKNPRQRATKINNLMHQERHDTRSENIVLHPGIPRRPHPFHDVQIGMMLRNLGELAPISVDGQC